MRGKQTCKILKEIRRQIAEANDIEFVTADCKYKGDCLGTCPKCEEEVRYLERQLRARRIAGRAVTLTGISVGVLALLTPATMPTQDFDPFLSPRMGKMPIHTETDTFTVKGKIYCAYLDTDGSMINEELFGAFVDNMTAGESVITDERGNFQINASVGDELRISFSKYRSYNITVKSDRFISVTFRDDGYNLGGEVPSTKYPIRVRDSKNFIDLVVLGQDGTRIDGNYMKVYRVWTGDDGKENQEDIIPVFVDVKHPYCLCWDWHKDLLDANGKPMKNASFRIEAEGYEDAVTVNVEYRTGITTKTICFKH